MGLEIYIIENIKKVKSDKVKSDEEIVFPAFLHDPIWAHKMKNLEVDAKYKGDYNDASFIYPQNDHNNFMKYLLKLINRNDLIDKDNEIKWKQIKEESYFPFKELIDFGDNESGCIDWEINEKLYKEFIKYDSQAKKFKYNKDEFKFYDFYEPGFDFYEFYNAWKEIFELGKEKNSVVILW